ncbi:hypothetical protein A2422_00670 [Candidatus Woesebacteria bacterium RIFOXYC1_FULL_31_51]|nr:MAG: hypothetical protein A2185_00240 [Candidatus Woesebacteria bacterium RIFOXYA1_FULL_31_71]OGM78613.1 MAG: hypothetical protein A2375_00500 [Candidatus Woesebacteria bacterium RIFOXYB1_FULL_31_120]OGM82364.1 MAG: hypothetical protein A2422_00670 [Candidatus Woesebacteria bacterium RIFOXYC1_FULL_31_51]OGM86482.1 MAG: hypothetical protein A2595_01060 [Candidatus Woesebacteria bacterium RIFOXYD1_FULL_31_53]
MSYIKALTKLLFPKLFLTKSKSKWKISQDQGIKAITFVLQGLLSVQNVAQRSPQKLTLGFTKEQIGKSCLITIVAQKVWGHVARNI